MNHYLFGFFLLIIPMQSFADKDPVPEQKIFIIEQSEKHRREAIESLLAANDMRILIPNLDDQKHMHSLIVGAIGSMAGGNLQTKILYVGIALIGSLATDVYDKYCEYRNLLVKTEHHLNMMKFYNTISNKLTNRVSASADQAFCTALDYINLAYKMVYSVEYEIKDDDEEGLHAISQDLKELRDYWTKTFLKSEGQITKKLSDHHLSENIYESLAEIVDETTRDKVFYCIDEAFRHLKIAEKLWGLDQKPGNASVEIWFGEHP